MQFAALIAAATTLAIGTNAAAIRRDGPRLAQFRVFGAEGCSALNYGFFTVDQSDVGVCKGIENVPMGVTSVNLEHVQLPAAEGCTLNIFTDDGCSEGERATVLNVCANIAEDGETWRSWSITCPTSP